VLIPRFDIFVEYKAYYERGSVVDAGLELPTHQLSQGLKTVYDELTSRGDLLREVDCPCQRKRGANELISRTNFSGNGS